MFLTPAQEVVAGDQALGRAREAPIAVEAGSNEALVRQIVAAEHRRDALEERGFRDRARGRQQAEDGPFDAVR